MTKFTPVTCEMAAICYTNCYKVTKIKKILQRQQRKRSFQFHYIKNRPVPQQSN